MSRARQSCLFVARGARRDALWLKGPVALLGRSPRCDLVLEGRGVSGHHALVRRTGDRHVVYDLESPGGIRVNGRLVARHILADGDVVGVGEIELVYVLSRVELELVTGREPAADFRAFD